MISERRSMYYLGSITFIYSNFAIIFCLIFYFGPSKNRNYTFVLNTLKGLVLLRDALNPKQPNFYIILIGPNLTIASNIKLLYLWRPIYIILNSIQHEIWISNTVFENETKWFFDKSGTYCFWLVHPQYNNLLRRTSSH